MSLTAYIRYDSTGRLVPGGPIVVAEKPAVGNWQAVTEGTNVTLSGKLKAFIKVDRFNKPIAGSLFFGKNKPATGKWIEVNATFTGGATPTTSTTTTAVPTTTTTTTEGVKSIYVYRNDINSNTLVLRNYDIDPNLYYFYTASAFLVYYQGPIGIGTQFFYNQALTQPIESYKAAFLPTTGYTVPSNTMFYTTDSSGTIVSELGDANSLAWNQFGGNPSLQSRVQNDLVPCNQMYPNGFILQPGVTTVSVGTTVYNGTIPFTGWNYLSYNGSIYVLNGGSVVQSIQSC